MAAPLAKQSSKSPLLDDGAADAAADAGRAQTFPVQFGAERLKGFADGYMSIIATVMSIPLTKLTAHEVDALRQCDVMDMDSKGKHYRGNAGCLLLPQVLPHRAANLLTYVLTFNLVANVWRRHARSMHGVDEISPRLLGLNVFVILPTVAFVPFTATIAVTYLNQPFGGSLFLANMALLYAALIAHQIMVAPAAGPGAARWSHGRVRALQRDALALAAAIVCIIAQEGGSMWPLWTFLLGDLALDWLESLPSGLAPVLCCFRGGGAAGGAREVSRAASLAPVARGGPDRAALLSSDSHGSGAHDASAPARAGAPSADGVHEASAVVSVGGDEAEALQQMREASLKPFGVDRLAAFSDGVLAVVMTLVILDLQPAEAATGQTEGGGGAVPVRLNTTDTLFDLPLVPLSMLLGHLAPLLVSSLLLLFVVGALWAVHHAVLHLLARTRGEVVSRIFRLNNMVCVCIGLLPFAFSIVASFTRDTFGTACVCGLLLMISALYALLLREVRAVHAADLERRARVASASASAATAGAEGAGGAAANADADAGSAGAHRRAAIDIAAYGVALLSVLAVVSLVFLVLALAESWHGEDLAVALTASLVVGILGASCFHGPAVKCLVACEGPKP